MIEHDWSNEALLSIIPVVLQDNLMKLYSRTQLGLAISVTLLIGFLFGAISYTVLSARGRSSNGSRPPVAAPASDNVSIALEVAATAVYEQMALSVVHIVPANGNRSAPHGFDIDDRTSTGSGIIVDRDGYVLTNYHVVSGMSRIAVNFGRNATAEGKIVGYDRSLDLALLRVDVPEDAAIAVAEFADSSRARVGQIAFAIGNPFSLGRTLSVGVVSGLGRVIYADDDTVMHDMIQTDASMNPGSSGGALFDSSGKLLGIMSVLYSSQGGSMGIGFAVSANTARALVVELLARQRDNS